MTETTKTRVTPRERKLQAELDTANKIVDAHVATIAALIAQLERAVTGQDSRREVPELVTAQIVTNRDPKNLQATELRVGDVVLTAPNGVIVTPAKRVVEVEGKRVPSSYRIPQLRHSFDRSGQMHMPAPAAKSFVEEAQAMGWVPAK
jgi:hypothetical protein